MPSQEHINGEIFSRINSLEASVAEMKGLLQAHLDQNRQLLKVVSLALKVMAVLCFVELFAIIYGAIGKDGLHAVREASTPIRTTSWIAPPPDCQITWRHVHHKA